MSRFDDVDDSRRKLLIQALAAGVFATIGDKAALAASIFGTPPSKLPAGQSIYRMSGEVTVNGKTADMSTRITANDTVQTSKDGELVFAVGGHAMLLRGGSQLELKSEAKEPESLVIHAMRMLTGRLLTVSRSQGTRVMTKTATIGIRGTGYYIESEPDQTYFCTCYGLTDVVSNDDPTSKDSVLATHHDKPLYIMGGEQAGKNIRRAGFKNHTDQELMLIETLVGRTPPFVFVGDDYSAPRRDY